MAKIILYLGVGILLIGLVTTLRRSGVSQVAPLAGVRLPDLANLIQKVSRVAVVPPIQAGVKETPLIIVPTVTATTAPSVLALPLATEYKRLFEETTTMVSLTTPTLQIRIEQASWKLTISDAAGKNLWQEPQAVTGEGETAAYGAPAFLIEKKLLSPTKAGLYPYDKQWFKLTKVTTVQWEEPVLTLNVQTDDPGGRTATVKFNLSSFNTISLNLELSDSEGVISTAVSSTAPAGEQYFGLGQRQIGAGQRGQRAINFVRGRLELDTVKGEGSYAPYPFFLSTNGYALLAETQRRNIFDMAATRTDAKLILVEAANLNLTFFVDKDPLKILEQYTARIGRPPLPPGWTFGVWKTSIGGQAQVEAEARRLRETGIPISTLLIYDVVDTASESGWEVPVFKPIAPGTYPNIPALNGTLHNMGYKTLTYVHEAIRPGTPRYYEGLTKSYFVRNQQGQPYLTKFNRYLIDFTNPAATVWFQDGLKRVLTELDFDGAMADTGDLTPLDAVLANGQSGYAMANIYPVLYAKAIYEAAQQAKPEAVFLMRTGYLGAQQYQKATWEGDLITHWDWRAGLPSAIPAALNRGISGSPYIGTEIAGYLQVNISQQAQKELYLRWTQYGAFNPIMRDILGQQGADAIYLWSDADTVANFKRYARIHTDLFPLFYTLAKSAAEKGLPIMRHPYLLYPTDPTAISQDREYLLGDSMLVAPVVTFGEREKPVYLPPGQWVDFWTDELLEGGRETLAKVPLETIPVYVKAGAILPTLLQPVQTLATLESPLDGGLRLKVYPHTGKTFTSSFDLYDGTKITYLRAGDELVLSLESDQTRPYRLELPSANAPIEANAQGLAGDFGQLSTASAASGWWYDQTKQQIVANITGSNLTLRFKLKL